MKAAGVLLLALFMSLMPFQSKNLKVVYFRGSIRSTSLGGKINARAIILRDYSFNFRKDVELRDRCHTDFLALQIQRIDS